jgi:PAS domain S-box-containing protein
MDSHPEQSVLDLDYADLDPDNFKPARTPVLLWGGLVVAMVVLAAIVVPLIGIDAKKTAMFRDIEEHEGILAAGNAEVLGTWLAGTLRLADLVLDSELFRLFGTEVALAEGDLARMVAPALGAESAEPELLPLIKQLPLIERVLTDFANNTGFLAAYMMGPTADPYAASAGALPVTAGQKQSALEALRSGRRVYGPVRQSAAGLEMDLYLPLLPAQAETEDSQPVAVVLMTTPLDRAFAEALAPHPLAAASERTSLLQWADGRLVEIRPGANPALRSVEAAIVSDGPGAIPFGVRPALDGSGDVYSLGIEVPGPGWILVQERDINAVNRALQGYAATAWTIALLVVLAVVAAFGAFWWRLASAHNRSLADQFGRFATRMRAQKRFLDSINNTIAEHIGLKGLDGTYRYANPAFAKAMGRDLDQVTGLDDQALFGGGTAERLKVADRKAVASGEVVTDQEEVYLGGELHHLQISKVPFKDEQDEVAGILSVTRDVTELVEQQARRELAIRQMVNALVKAIELRDPYLGGHSRRVRGFAVAVARELGASLEEITTLELAAELSQIGKLAVPREILTKPARLEGGELEEIEKHLDHAAAILRDIDFELPVLDTLYQMHERLDGKGYPKGLKGAEISMAARILGACDVFCARIEPRSYRPGISAAQALDVLDQNHDRYDPKVVAALRVVAASVSGEKLMAGALQ